MQPSPQQGRLCRKQEAQHQGEATPTVPPDLRSPSTCISCRTRCSSGQGRSHTGGRAIARAPQYSELPRTAEYPGAENYRSYKTWITGWGTVVASQSCLQEHLMNGPQSPGAGPGGGGAGSVLCCPACRKSEGSGALLSEAHVSLMVEELYCF